MTLDDLKHAQRERLIFLDRCFTWRGIANRKDLIARFGISIAQAALDFRAYLDLKHAAPPVYDVKRKAYIADAAYQPLMPGAAIDAFDILSDDAENDSDLPAILPRPKRQVAPTTIALLFQALCANKAVQIRYTSIASGASNDQWIAPTRFLSDGETIYVRGYSDRHGEYRNYLPIRIEPDSTLATRDIEGTLPPDKDWRTRVTIWLRPKSVFSEHQASIIRREYGFDGRWLRVETRKALEFFFDRRWGLDAPGARLERAKTTYSAV